MIKNIKIIIGLLGMLGIGFFVAVNASDIDSFLKEGISYSEAVNDWKESIQNEGKQASVRLLPNEIKYVDPYKITNITDKEILAIYSDKNINIRGNINNKEGFNFGTTVPNKWLGIDSKFIVDNIEYKSFDSYILDNFGGDNELYRNKMIKQFLKEKYHKDDSFYDYYDNNDDPYSYIGFLYTEGGSNMIDNFYNYFEKYKQDHIKYISNGLPTEGGFTIENAKYKWNTGDYGTCSKECGTGTKYRLVYCEREDGAIGSESFCHIMLKPFSSESCFIKECEQDEPEPLVFKKLWYIYWYGQSNETIYNQMYNCLQSNPGVNVVHWEPWPHLWCGKFE